MLKRLTKKWSFVLLGVWIISWIGNLVRFPLYVVEYWSVFFLVYTLLLILWVWLLLWEVSLSQKYQKWRWSLIRWSTSKTWGLFSSIRSILSRWWVLFVFLLLSYYVVYLWRSVDYLWYTLVWLFTESNVFWWNEWVQSSFSFFSRDVLWASSDYLEWWLFSFPVIIWVCVWVILLSWLLWWSMFSFMRKSIHLTISVFWMLVILTCWAIFLPWATTHRSSFLTFDGSLFFSSWLWLDAVRHMITSLMIWCWLLWTFASMKHRDSELRRWVVYIIMWDYIISLLWCVLVWSLLSSSISLSWNTLFTEWVVSLTFLFGILPDTILQWWRWWSLFLVLFFVVCILLMITTIWWLCAYIIHSFSEFLKRKSTHSRNANVLLFLVFLLSLVYTRSHWLYVMDMLSGYIYSLLLPVLWVATCVLCIADTKRLTVFLNQRSTWASKRVLPMRLIALWWSGWIILFLSQLIMIGINWFEWLTWYNTVFQVYWIWIVGGAIFLLSIWFFLFQKNFRELWMWGYNLSHLKLHDISK